MKITKQEGYYSLLRQKDIQNDNKKCSGKFRDKPEGCERNFGVVALKSEHSTFSVDKAVLCETGLDNHQTSKKNNSQSFKGAGDTVFNILDKGYKVLDKNAVRQVSLLDLLTAIIPRTAYDLQTSLAAALETFRRESSGLIINCLIPGFIVKHGVAKLLPKSNELKDTNVVDSWANSDSIDKLKDIYKNAHKSNAKDKTREYVHSSLTSLRGLDGTKWIDYDSKSQTAEFQSAVDDVTNAINNHGKEREKLLKSAGDKLAELTKAESILEFNGKPQSNLKETLRDITDLGEKFNSIKEKLEKKADNIPKKITHEELSEAIDKYGKELKSFVTKKSLIGLGIVMGIAVSIQSINRAITRKQFNAEGAPIYKDFGKKDTSAKMDEEQKKNFFAHKLLAAGSMMGLAGLSMMKKPTLKMFEFSGIFPTLDQCRWIASATFASRMLASEDENELRESTVRDLVSFAGLYFLGDYAKKAAASAIETFSKTQTGKKLVGENIVLLNRKKIIEKPTDTKVSSLVKYRIQQFKNWIKNAELKTANEVSGKNVRNLRNLCRTADIMFGFTILGVLLPVYNRKVTERKVEEAKKEEAIKKRTAVDLSIIQNNTSEIFKNLT